MAAIGRFIMDTASAAISALGVSNDSSSTSAFQDPSPDQVREVKNIFLETSKLPLEIIDTIIDYAEYWPCTTVSTRSRSEATGTNNEDVFILRTLPLGYSPTNAGGAYSFPEDVYQSIKPEPRGPCESESVKASTLDVLNHWQTQSRFRTEHPCRKIVFSIKSRDQGWVSNLADQETYTGSFTWFDVGIERVEAANMKDCESLPRGFSPQFNLGLCHGQSFPISCSLRSVLPAIIKDGSETQKYTFDHPFLPEATRLQSNKTGSRDYCEYSITWSYKDCINPESTEGDKLNETGRGRETATGQFVRDLAIGDAVTVWARARFRRWRNLVDSVKITMYWAV